MLYFKRIIWLYLLTHAEFRQLWELRFENLYRSVCTLTCMHVCVMLQLSCVCWSSTASSIWKASLNKPWFWRKLCILLGAPPSFMCVCEALSVGRLREFLIWNSRSELHAEAPGLLLKEGVATDWVTPQLPLLFTHPSFFCLVSFFFTASHSHPSFTFIDPLLQKSWLYSPFLLGY